MTATQTRKIYSRTIRQAAGVSGIAYPIVRVDGDAAPKVVGRSAYWTTLSGKTEVRYPNAYGYPTLYHRSERRIEVGRDWLASQGLPCLA
jgi:hypothetical protein